MAARTLCLILSLALPALSLACNSAGPPVCAQSMKRQLDPYISAGNYQQVCKVKEGVLTQYRACVMGHLKGCAEATRVSLMATMESAIKSYESYDEFCSDDDYDYSEEEPEVICNTAQPYQCSQALRKKLAPKIPDPPTFCAEKDADLAEYKKCVETNVAGCHEKIREQYIGNMRREIEGYRTHDYLCEDDGEEGCDDAQEREDAMFDCEQEDISSLTGDQEKCRALREEAECAWKEAEGCSNTEDIYREDFASRIMEFNRDLNCGIHIQGAPTVPPPKPTEPAKKPCPQLTECTKLTKPTGNHEEEKTRNALQVKALVVELEKIRAGQTPDRDVICSVLQAHHDYKRLWTCVTSSLVTCRGDDVLGGEKPDQMMEGLIKECKLDNRTEKPSSEECFD